MIHDAFQLNVSTMNIDTDIIIYIYFEKYLELIYFQKENTE